MRIGCWVNLTAIRLSHPRGHPACPASLGTAALMDVTTVWTEHGQHVTSALQTHIGETNLSLSSPPTSGPSHGHWASGWPEHEQSEHYLVIMPQESLSSPSLEKGKFVAVCYFVRPTPGNQPSPNHYGQPTKSQPTNQPSPG